jgi:hypothetical protein
MTRAKAPVPGTEKIWVVLAPGSSVIESARVVEQKSGSASRLSQSNLRFMKFPPELGSKLLGNRAWKLGEDLAGTLFLKDTRLQKLWMRCRIVKTLRQTQSKRVRLTCQGAQKAEKRGGVFRVLGFEFRVLRLESAFQYLKFEI